MENNVQEPLEVEVAAPGSPESPEPSPQSPSPVFQMPAGDASNFMGFYSTDDIDDLEYWAKKSRDLRRVSRSLAEDPEISENLKLFLKYTLCPQWQFKPIHPAGEVLIFQLRAHLIGYELLAPFNLRQWLRLFSAWTVSERLEQLELLANSGGFQII